MKTLKLGSMTRPRANALAFAANSEAAADILEAMEAASFRRNKALAEKLFSVYNLTYMSVGLLARDIKLIADLAHDRRVFESHQKRGEQQMQFIKDHGDAAFEAQSPDDEGCEL